ncbi:(2Fe-2S) ferredoxin domain-containing protein [Pelagibacterium halotolerans]|uniref:Ferredoxin, 2Fe-2S n=1 Tax=Pelagibacterium halotolerans (strain DSM 22347 / JCM 15775 / CGMCC 1.7692 / B2) TaxID=1082931 RepID=G4RAY4_PELHB|nr:(2Fe-2S) ferredoxin domain-containing protein [Pelagibacterium halotolerans]AEQ53620.1 hypothetical protein KKY_3638 [Pelagibacterium halotolerans B2]QJR20206.1 (2Fe-2S) ferredoxin domain-containing protein [Pelagibacterium halotolerans]SEA91449.1 (2Fe-2S) ferredoxin [Pelagibacterium halotolerans]
MQPDFILFAISQYNLSAGKFRTMAARLEAACASPAMLVRLEGTGTSLPDALDALVAQGRRRILVQPVGLPFMESLRAWLPGAIKHWLDQTGRDDIEVAIGSEIVEATDLLEQLALATLANAEAAEPITSARASLGKPGWERPPDFTNHIFVCTGPRCHYRDAASLPLELKAELGRQDVARKCLTTRTACMFPCNKGPMVAVYPRGEWYHLPDSDALARFVKSVIVEDTTLPDLLFFTAAGPAAPAAAPAR